MNTIVPTTTLGYYEDAQGRLVPISQIKEFDLARDALVTEIVAKARALHQQLGFFRVCTFADIQAFTELSAERYGAKLGGRRGNVSLVSFDGRHKIERAISDKLAFDEGLQAAKALIDECLREWATNSRPEIITLINDAFQVDKQGRIDTDRVLSLRKHDIKDARWLRAMEAISESLRVDSSKAYLRIYERDDATGDWRQITLSLASSNA